MVNCPNCKHRQKNASSNGTLVYCDVCGYSWVSISNSNIKAAGIKVIMDSANHYNYTIDSAQREGMFPFYAMNNNFIENSDTRNVKNQNTTKLDILKNVSKRSHTTSAKLTNFDYQRIPLQSTNRSYSGQTNYHRDYELNEDKSGKLPYESRTGITGKESGAFSAHNDYKKENKDTISTHSMPRRDREDLVNTRSSSESFDRREKGFHERENKDAREYSFDSTSRDEKKINEEIVAKHNEPIIKSFSRDSELKKQETLRERLDKLSTSEYLSEGYDFIKNEEIAQIHEDGSITRTSDKKTTDSIKEKKDRLSDEQKTYKRELAERVNRVGKKDLLTVDKYKKIKDARLAQKVYNSKLEDFSSDFSADNKDALLNSSKAMHSKPDEGKKTNNTELKEEKRGKIKKSRYETPYKERLKQRLEEKQKSTSNKLFNNKSVENYSQDRDISDIDHKTLPKDFFYDTTHTSAPIETPQDRQNTKNQSYSHTQAYENYEDFNKSSLAMAVEDLAKYDYNYREKTISRTPKSFKKLYERFKGPFSKSDPLGLNQSDAEFFKKTENSRNWLKFSFSQLIHELRGRIDIDKFSFRLVVLIFILGALMLAPRIFDPSKSQDASSTEKKNIDIGKALVNIIPTIDDTSAITKAASGTSDALVIKKIKPTNDKELPEFNAVANEDKKEILNVTTKKETTTNLSVEDLKRLEIDKNNLTSPISINIDLPSKTAYLEKKRLQLKQVTDNWFSDVKLQVIKSAWSVGNNKYFEIKINLENSSKKQDYLLNTLEIIILDISGNVIGTREIHPNKFLRKQERSTSIIRLPNVPILGSGARVFLKKITETKR